MGRNKDDEMDERPLSFAELAEIPLDEMSPEELQRFELLTSLEEKKEALAMSGAKKAARALKHEGQEETFRIQWQSDMDRARNCTHWKGGDGLRGLQGQGNGVPVPERSILAYGLSQDVLGYPRLHCTRCHFEWRIGFRKELMYREVGAKTGPGFEMEWLPNPTGFSYEEVMAWRNGNQPSTPVRFQWGPKAMEKARKDIIPPAKLLKQMREQGVLV